MGKIGAFVAAVVAGAAAAGATVWAKRRKGEDELDLEVTETASLGEGAAEAETEPGEAPVPVVETAGVAGAADDLTSLKGVGVAIAERLHGIGVTTFAQIAAWSDDDIAKIAPQIKAGADRIKREDWVGQARAASEG